LLAAGLTWPLAANARTHLPGPPSGDTGVYVWNLWVFRHEIVTERNFPLNTSAVFSLVPGANLGLHNYTLFANVLAFPLLPSLGPVATYNVLLMLFLALDGWCTFLLARRLTGRGYESWMAGALFEASPALIARTTAHFSLVAAFPLPFVVLATLRGLDRGTRRDAALTGAAVALAGFCDPYYAVYAVLFIGALLAARTLEWRWQRRPAGAVWRRALDVLIAALVATAALVVVSGGRTVVVFGVPVVLRTLYTPMLVLTVLVGARLLATWRPAVSLTERIAWPQLARFVVIAAVVCVCLLSPTLIALGRGLAQGRFDHVPMLWRSSPPGVDLLAFVAPSPNHPLYGQHMMPWLTRERPDGYPEFTASLPWAALVVIGIAIARWRARMPPLWIGLACAATALALGPFIRVASINTTIPGPWALLRYVPVIDWARSPSRFAIVVALLVAVLFAYAFAALRDAVRRRALLTAGVVALLAFELLPVPRPLWSARVPSVYARVKAHPDRRARVLALPTGIRDGTSSLGRFSAQSQFFQTHHEKRLLGGYLSRVSRKRKRDVMSLPVFSALVALSEGKPLTAEQEATAWNARGAFLRRARIGYVVMDAQATPPPLREFAIRLLDLELLEVADGHALYRPRTMRLPPVRAARLP
jgi:hypothetical protein